MYVLNTLFLNSWFGGSVYSKMFNSIADAILNFVAHLCGALVDGCINVINTIGTDVSNIIDLFPVINELGNVFEITGFTLAMMIFIVSLPMMFMSRFTDSDMPANSPLQLVCRTGVSILLCTQFIPFIYSYVIGADGIFTVLFEHFSNLNVPATSSVTEDLIVTLLTDGWVSNGSGNIFATAADAATFIILIFFFIYLCILLLKFLFFHIQKFLMSTILLYASPLAASTYVNKKTAPIWKNYFSLYAVNLLTLLFNIIIMKFIQSGLNNLVSWKESYTVANDRTDKSYTILLGVMAICAIAKIAKQMGVYIGQVFNVNGMTEQIRASLGEIGGVAAAGFAAYNGISRMTGKGPKGGANVQGFNISGFTGDDGKFHGKVTLVSADTKGKGDSQKGEDKGKNAFRKFASRVGSVGSGDRLYYGNEEEKNKNGVETKQTDMDKDLNGTKDNGSNSDNNQKGSETSAIPKTSNDDKSDKNKSEYIPGSPDNYKKPEGFEKKGSETSVTPKASNPDASKGSDKNSVNGTSVGKTGVVQSGSVKGGNVNGGTQNNHSNNSSTNISNDSSSSSRSIETSGGNTKNVNVSGANTHSYDGVQDTSKSKQSKHSASTQTAKNNTPKNSEKNNNRGTHFDKKPADTSN